MCFLGTGSTRERDKDLELGRQARVRGGLAQWAILRSTLTDECTMRLRTAISMCTAMPSTVTTAVRCAAQSSARATTAGLERAQYAKQRRRALHRVKRGNQQRCGAQQNVSSDRHAARASVDATLVDKHGERKAEGRDSLQAARGPNGVLCNGMSNMDAGNGNGRSIAGILKSMQRPDTANNNESRIESSL